MDPTTQGSDGQSIMRNTYLFRFQTYRISFSITDYFRNAVRSFYVCKVVTGSYRPSQLKSESHEVPHCGCFSMRTRPRLFSPFFFEIYGVVFQGICFNYKLVSHQIMETTLQIPDVSKRQHSIMETTLLASLKQRNTSRECLKKCQPQDGSSNTPETQFKRFRVSLDFQLRRRGNPTLHKYGATNTQNMGKLESHPT